MVFAMLTRQCINIQAFKFNVWPPCSHSPRHRPLSREHLKISFSFSLFIQNRLTNFFSSSCHEDKNKKPSYHTTTKKEDWGLVAFAALAVSLPSLPSPSPPLTLPPLPSPSLPRRLCHHAHYVSAVAIVPTWRTWRLRGVPPVCPLISQSRFYWLIVPQVHEAAATP